jgi:1-aminocyclopropane-1-carboxylate deaminase/D-cysteine desulfhydrase-like pyridoxal-dependent ACC family enzyme
MRRLEEDLGTDVEIYFKREDLLRPLCGNKIRYLEYVLGAYDQEAADCLVHCGGQTSNYMAQLAIVGAAEGIPVHLILLGEPPDEPNGNPLIEDLLGAHIYYRAGKFGGSCSNHKADLSATLREEGKRPYVIDYPFSNYSAILGYMTAYLEMRAQIEGGGAPEFDHFFLCSGSNSFLGLRMAANLAGDTTPITAFPPITWKENGLDHVAPDLDTFARIKIQEFSNWIEQNLQVNSLDFDERHVGSGYGIPTKASIDAVRQVGRCEGILLDPIYTGKAMAGLIARIENNEFEPGSRLLFFQSGGPINALGNFREFAQNSAT